MPYFHLIFNLKMSTIVLIATFWASISEIERQGFEDLGAVWIFALSSDSVEEWDRRDYWYAFHFDCPIFQSWKPDYFDSGSLQIFWIAADSETSWAAWHFPTLPHRQLCSQIWQENHQSSSHPIAFAYSWHLDSFDRTYLNHPIHYYFEYVLAPSDQRIGGDS